MIWIADFGAGHHLASTKDIPASALWEIKPCDIQLATASGVIPARCQLEVHVPELGIDAKVPLLDYSPPV